MHAPGAALSVTDREQTLGVVVRGHADVAAGRPVDPETRFQIGSISKSFVAIVAMQEADAGRLDLHAPVTDIVPWIDIPQPFGAIQMHHLLSHTSGLAIGTEAVLSGLGAVWNLRRFPPGFAPGDRFWYSNDGYKLVGVVLEHVTGSSIERLLQERVLMPLQMNHSTAAITNDVRMDQAIGYSTMYDDRPPQRDHPLVEAPWIVCNTADGSIVSDAVDMAAYARSLLNRGAGVLDAESFGRLVTPVIAAEDEPYDYAYGLHVSPDGQELWHSGGMPGFTARLECHLDSGLGCVVLLNGDGDKAEIATFALRAVRAALEGESPPNIEAPRDPASTADASEYAGVYRSPDRVLEVVAEENRLSVREDDVEAILERAEGDSFLVSHPRLGRFYLRFGRDAAGRVVEAFHGGDWLPSDAYVGPGAPAAPSEWASFVGHYRGPGLWEPSFRVVIRKGTLLKISPNAETGEAELELVRQPDGAFRVGVEEWRPDRIRFDAIVDGLALRADFNGASWYRTFED
jgi:CubicO group peptidase (beta-lactamase class C family)